MKVYFSDPNPQTISQTKDYLGAKYALPDYGRQPKRQDQNNKTSGKRFDAANTDGYIAWNFSPLLATQSNCLEDGTVYLMRFTLPQKATCAGVGFYIKTAGETDPNRKNQVGLFNAAGKQLRRQTITDEFGEIGLCGIDWQAGPVALAPGSYYAAVLLHTNSPAHLASWPENNISAYVSRMPNTYQFAILCNLNQGSLPDIMTLSELLPSIVSIWSALY